MPNSDDFILFHSFESTIHAHMVLSLLEDEGIQAYLADEHTAAVANAFAGVVELRLMVHATDFERAEDLLSNSLPPQLSDEELTHQALQSQGGDWPGEEPTSSYGTGLLQCPHCQSRDVKFSPQHATHIVLVSLFTGSGVFLAIFAPITHFQLLGLLLILLSLTWAFLRRNHFPRHCRACNHQAPIADFRQP